MQCTCAIFSSGLSDCTIFFHISHKRHDFHKKVIEYKICILIVSTTWHKNSHSKKNSARYGQKCILVFMKSNRYFCQIIMKIEFSGQIFEKYLYFLKNPSDGSFSMRMDGRTDRRLDTWTGRQTGMAKLIVAFRNFSNAPKY